MPSQNLDDNKKAIKKINKYINIRKFSSKLLQMFASLFLLPAGREEIDFQNFQRWIVLQNQKISACMENERQVENALSENKN